VKALTVGIARVRNAWQPNISAVFLGLVTNVEEGGVPIILNGEKAMTSRLHAIFKVVEAFRGISARTTTVISGGDLCGFPFSKGHCYLVYGRLLANGEVYVTISSSTKWEKEASDDLKYLRGLPTAPRGATIHGSVFRYTTPENPASKAIRGGNSRVRPKNRGSRRRSSLRGICRQSWQFCSRRPSARAIRSNSKCRWPSG